MMFLLFWFTGLSHFTDGHAQRCEHGQGYYYDDCDHGRLLA
jgi:hypothetical protein